MVGFQSGLMTTGLCVIVTQSHVTCDTRPSRISACNIEKLGMGQGIRLGLSVLNKWASLIKIINSTQNPNPRGMGVIKSGNGYILKIMHTLMTSAPNSWYLPSPMPCRYMCMYMYVHVGVNKD